MRTESVVTLGEGFSPILPLAEAPAAPGVRLLLKDDGVVPTGSFKARGMAVAVSRAYELGLRELFVPSAGNAGVALSAYGARAGIRVRIYLPEQTAASVQEMCRRYGAGVRAVPGTIREAGVVARESEKGRGSFDMSTLREPYRVEGKKTMGLEIYEQSPEGGMPDAILYPTGGGTGLVGMYKAFGELRSVGLLERFPRLYAVQPEGCAPVVRALRDGEPRVTPWEHPTTLAPGLLVPAPFASERILEAGTRDPRRWCRSHRPADGGGDGRTGRGARGLRLPRGRRTVRRARCSRGGRADPSRRDGPPLQHGTGLSFSLDELRASLARSAEGRAA